MVEMGRCRDHDCVDVFAGEDLPVVGVGILGVQLPERGGSLEPGLIDVAHRGEFDILGSSLARASRR
jgi:hypothetical protein